MTAQPQYNILGTHSHRTGPTHRVSASSHSEASRSLGPVEDARPVLRRRRNSTRVQRLRTVGPNNYAIQAAMAAGWDYAPLGGEQIPSRNCLCRIRQVVTEQPAHR